MTKEEIEMYYDLLGFKYEAAIGALYARDLVDDEWVRQSRKRFFDKLERERELHFRRVSDYEASIRLFFSMMNESLENMFHLQILHANIRKTLLDIRSRAGCVAKIRFHFSVFGN